MGLDIYISEQKITGKECLIHWRKLMPIVQWLEQEVYNGTIDCKEHRIEPILLQQLRNNCENILNAENWKQEMQKHLFQVSSNFTWTGIRELTYLQMMKTIADDIDAVAPLVGKELFVQITY